MLSKALAAWIDAPRLTMPRFQLLQDGIISRRSDGP